jgi:cytochrome c-type biogenesis protein CcmH
MTRWLPAVAAGALLAVVAFAAVTALRPAESVTTVDRSERLARELRCPDCQGLSVADSPTEAASSIRRQIDDLLASGASDADVREHFVDRYGEWILLAPSSPVLWLIPLGLVVAATIGLGAWLVRRPHHAHATPPAVGSDDRRRLRDEVEALDA